MAKNPLSLKDAVSMGEYDPEYLSRYEEFGELSPHVQLQCIREAMEERRKQLITQLAELYNVLDFRLKPELKEAIDNVQNQLRKIESDRERIYLSYSKKS